MLTRKGRNFQTDAIRQALKLLGLVRPDEVATMRLQCYQVLIIPCDGAVMRDKCLDTLLQLDGVTMFPIEGRGFWVKFDVAQVPVSSERPHGLKYSLTLHKPNGERIVGFDNAHEIKTGSGPGKKVPTEWDHKHRFRSIKPYDYEDAAALLADFWSEVDGVLRELGEMA